MTNVYVNSQVNALNTAANTEVADKPVVATHAPKAVKINKRVRAEEIFQRELPKLDQKNATPWRTNVVKMIMDDLDITINNASTVYNFAKKRAIAEGKIGDFGRSPSKAVLKEQAEAAAKAAEEAKAEQALVDEVIAQAEADAEMVEAPSVEISEPQEEVKMPPMAVTH